MISECKFLGTFLNRYSNWRPIPGRQGHVGVSRSHRGERGGVWGGGPGGNGTGTVVAFPYTLRRLSEAKKDAGQGEPRWKKPRLLLGGLDP